MRLKQDSFLDILRKSFPKEHGMWAIFSVNFIIGTFTASKFSLASLFLLFMCFFGFLGVYAYDSFRNKEKWYVNPIAYIYFFISFVLFLHIVLLYKKYYLVFFSAIFLIFIITMAFLKSIRKDKTLYGEIVGTTALSFIAPLSYYVAEDIHYVYDKTLLLLWFVSWGFFVGSIFYVRFVARKKKYYAYMMWIYHIVLFGGLAYLCEIKALSYLVMIAFLPSFVKAVWIRWFDIRKKRVNIRTIGYLELVSSILFMVFVILSFKFRYWF
jgi:hypothetical protein